MAGDRASGPRIALGSASLLLALAILAWARWQSIGGPHAWDVNPSPPARYALTAGRVYQLSLPNGVKGAQALGLVSGADPQCSAVGGDGRQQSLAVLSTRTDVRDLRVFATFRAAATGPVHIECLGADQVFVDDADGLGRDLSGVLLLLSTAFAVTGVVLGLSGLYSRRRSGRPTSVTNNTPEEPGRSY